MDPLCIESLVECLCNISSPSGYENDITSYLREVMSQIGFSVYSDTIGNLYCRKKGNGDLRVMFIAHCDEIGFVVKYISDDGYIYFSNLSKTDLSLLYGRHVLISHSGKTVSGVIGSCPTHLGGNDASNKEISNLWIDIGARSKEEAEKSVLIGDCITIKPDISNLGNHYISSKALDNRASIAAILKACNIVKDLELPYDLYVVFSVQEEVGLIGSAPAFYSVKPDIGIALDVTHATDVPNIDNRRYGDIRLDKGPVIPIGSNLSSVIQDRIRSVAAEVNVPFQIEVLPGFSGTEIAQAQITGSGCHTGLISIPCRYMHSPVETVSIADIENASLLIESLMKRFDGQCKLQSHNY